MQTLKTRISRSSTLAAETRFRIYGLLCLWPRGMSGHVELQSFFVRLFFHESVAVIGQAVE